MFMALHSNLELQLRDNLTCGKYTEERKPASAFLYNFARYVVLDCGLHHQKYIQDFGLLGLV